MIHPSICLEMIYEEVPFVDRIDRVAELGFDTVEFWTWPDKDVDAIEARLAEREVSLAGMGANRERTRPEELQRALTDPKKRDAAVRDIEASIEIAERLDCPNLIVLTGPVQDRSHEVMYESVVKGLREVAPAAEAAGVSLVVEPLNTAVDHEGYFLRESSVGYEIVHDVDSPAVKLLFDIYHQQITEGNVIENVTGHIDEIGHLHVADVPGRHEPGTGELHYPNVFSAIDAADYEGYVGFEFSPKRSDEEALTSIRELVEG